ncbi:MAG TPA: hypothetical protein VNE39_21035 [Planctomycetota bacterium]|nr:hypothetical protein [Planctomycetota bacterium]
MNCERFDDIAELLVAGELAEAELAEADAHAAECAACRERVQMARAQLRALEAALAPHRAAEGFVERTMARVRAQVAPPEEERPETLRGRLLRYAAMAAAAALLVMAGYGFLHRGSTAWVENGAAAVVGPTARRLGPASRLAAGDLVATPADSGATLALAGGRLRVALAPLTLVRIMDPRSGTALQLVRGEVYCRGSGSEATPMVASPLANVAAGPGVVSLHVTPEPGAKQSPTGAEPFRGMVTLAAHDGAARVLVPGRQVAGVPLQRGQVLMLSTDRRRGYVAPVPIERLREVLEAEHRAVRTRHADLELRWEALLGGRLDALRGERAQLPRRAGELQEALSQTRSLHAELERRLKLLDRCQAEGQQVFRLVVRPAPPQR